MLEVIYDINKYLLSENYVLVSFDVVNMFPNIINKSGLLSVQETLTDRIFICLVLMLTLPWPTMSLLLISSI